MPNQFLFGATVGKQRNTSNADIARTGTREGAAYIADYLTMLSMEGRIFSASMSAANTTQIATGQTSFADTIDTLHLSVPSGVTALPLFVNLAQAGTVAGGAISVVVEIDNADPYASGGTALTALSLRTDGVYAALCTPRINPTLTTGAYGVVVQSYFVGPDVSTAEGAINGIYWTPKAPIFLVGPASLKVYTWAGTTAPTWFPALSWAEIPSSSIT